MVIPALMPRPGPPRPGPPGPGATSLPVAISLGEPGEPEEPEEWLDPNDLSAAARRGFERALQQAVAERRLTASQAVAAMLNTTLWKEIFLRWRVLTQDGALREEDADEFARRGMLKYTQDYIVPSVGAVPMLEMSDKVWLQAFYQAMDVMENQRLWGDMPDETREGEAAHAAAAYVARENADKKAKNDYMAMLSRVARKGLRPDLYTLVGKAFNEVYQRWQTLATDYPNIAPKEFGGYLQHYVVPSLSDIDPLLKDTEAYGRFLLTLMNLERLDTGQPLFEPSREGYVWDENQQEWVRPLTPQEIKRLAPGRPKLDKSEIFHAQGLFLSPEPGIGRMDEEGDWWVTPEEGNAYLMGPVAYAAYKKVAKEKTEAMVAAAYKALLAKEGKALPTLPVTGEEPWQMTLQEFTAFINRQRQAKQQPFLTQEQLSGAHRKAIAAALAARKPVPADILKEYPDLGPPPYVPSLPVTGEEPWQMTLREFTAFTNRQRQIANLPPVSQEEVSGVHREAIAAALTEGKVIPKQVLGEYPDLSIQKYTRNLPTADKELWEMTLAEFTSEINRQRQIGRQPFLTQEQLSGAHRNVVTSAIVSGKTIPPVTLSQYPDLGPMVEEMQAGVRKQAAASAAEEARAQAAKAAQEQQAAAVRAIPSWGSIPISRYAPWQNVTTPPQYAGVSAADEASRVLADLTEKARLVYQNELTKSNEAWQLANPRANLYAFPGSTMAPPVTLSPAAQEALNRLSSLQTEAVQVAQGEQPTSLEALKAYNRAISTQQQALTPPRVPIPTPQEAASQATAASQLTRGLAPIRLGRSRKWL